MKGGFDLNPSTRRQGSFSHMNCFSHVRGLENSQYISSRRQRGHENPSEIKIDNPISTRARAQTSAVSPDDKTWSDFGIEARRKEAAKSRELLYDTPSPVAMDRSDHQLMSHGWKNSVTELDIRRSSPLEDERAAGPNWLAPRHS
ncbi:hypothetical protein SISSUDRAFT_1055153 [Sistotremastrum suecicum HHB10207 ss-3]|uniref:Uncharacterized protein n=1 Tax=Sistotremastrum suecicum HHB10207 ss-3 TaxID=1314776 RepID=A0A165Y0H8_9AGAM|nr:hypothetical protein SISSUDRAFT_1055153 [Sistotremastrum suecicum HHB10207 ss-3]